MPYAASPNDQLDRVCQGMLGSAGLKEDWVGSVGLKEDWVVVLALRRMG